jgi:dihydrofolate reductase
LNSRVRGISLLLCLALLVVGPSLLGGRDVAPLALLRPAAEQNDDSVAVLTEVDPISRPKIDAVLEYAAPTPFTFEKLPSSSRRTAAVTFAAATASRLRNQAANGLDPARSRYSGIDTEHPRVVRPYFDEEAGEEIDRLFKNFDLLLGRKTYEIFAAFWPYYDEADADGGIAKAFSDVKKYVVSRSGDVDTGWAGSVLLRDIAGVTRLKQEDGPTLVTQGRSELVHALLANDLVDAMSIFTIPVVLGRGKKLFADDSAPHSFKLTRSRVSPSGLIVGHYEREGKIRIGDTALDSPSKREVARQERMKREG